MIPQVDREEYVNSVWMTGRGNALSENGQKGTQDGFLPSPKLAGEGDYRDSPK